MKISRAPNVHRNATHRIYRHTETGTLGAYQHTTGKFYAPITAIPGGFQWDGRRKHVEEFKNAAGVPNMGQYEPYETWNNWFSFNGWRVEAFACNHESIHCQDSGYQPVTQRKDSGAHADGCRCLGKHPPGMAGDILAALWRGVK